MNNIVENQIINYGHRSIVFGFNLLLNLKTILGENNEKIA